ncbi:MAG: hypothetical protein ACT6U0_15410 [Shinella sp.]|uniref:hypothetical protein n=1 Tax=Shinella sp. TaxID=1870904 RepID=UPI004034F8DA
MATVRIHEIESDRHGCVLSRLLKLLAPRSLQANWTISAIASTNSNWAWFEATGDGGEQLEMLAPSKARLPGYELAALAKKTQQVIWGSFVGSLSSANDGVWLTIRAIDSTFYEVSTSDEVVLKAIKSTVGHVELSEGPWLPQPATPDSWAR